MGKLSAKLVEVKTGDEHHTVFQCPDCLGEDVPGVTRASSYNLVMLDVSGSMWCYFPHILQYWNEVMAPLLTGLTKIYVFGSEVYFRREGKFLEESDMLDQSTNLTDAIKVIMTEFEKSTESFNRLFLVTDGHHNATHTSPEVEIANLYIPSGKTIEVYLLGVGTSFPVEYSITIRSSLHNGNSNVPSLFWAETGDEESIHEQILSMADILKKGNVKLKISPSGFLTPGLPSTNTCYLGEHIYFPIPASEILSSLKLSTEEGVPLDMDLATESGDLRYFLEKVFCQWNSLIIQQHKKKEYVPKEAFEVMEKIYSNLIAKLTADLENVELTSVRGRLQKKMVKSLKTEFDTLMNQSKALIEIEGKFESELELAKSILKTTVKSKYDTKNLKMKGYGIDDYAEDMNTFREIYENLKDKIMSLPEPSVDDCCRVTLGSFVKDLQDPYFEELLQEDKFSFMKTVSVTGVPIYAPVKDSSQINPWTLVINRILKSPYTIISQTTLELSADADKYNSESADKEVFLQEDDEESRFNAVVPLFSQEVADVLKPLLRTNIFAMLSTFCILKNPHIVDHNAHLAALGCTWIKMITDYPKTNRPEFATDLISMIETTAKIYVDRKGIAKYFDVLLSDPSSALMTECPIEGMEKPLKCESLVKPFFLLNLSREASEVKSKLPDILARLITEFIGRCIVGNSDILPEQNIYSILFVPEFSTKEKRIAWIEEKLDVTCSEVLSAFEQEKGKSLFASYFYVERLLKDLKLFCVAKMDNKNQSLYNIEINMNLIKKLRNRSSAGNIKLNSIDAFAQEMEVEEETRKMIFSKEKMFVYLVHCLQHRVSRARMLESLPSEEEARRRVEEKVASESWRAFQKLVVKKVLEEGQKKWIEEFLAIHTPVVVRPMSKMEIIKTASSKDFKVTEETFNDVYKYNPKSGLMRNACMVETCPFYLVPNRSFNQHISVERRNGFPHKLHKVALEVASKGGEVDEIIATLIKKQQEKQEQKEEKEKQEKNENASSPSSAETLNKLKSEINRLILDYIKFIG